MSRRLLLIGWSVLDSTQSTLSGAQGPPIAPSEAPPRVCNNLRDTTQGEGAGPGALLAKPPTGYTRTQLPQLDGTTMRRFLPCRSALRMATLLLAMPLLLAQPASAQMCQFSPAIDPAIVAFVEEVPFPTAPLYLVSSYHISSLVQALWLFECNGTVHDRLDNSPDACVANQGVSQLPKALGPSVQWTAEAPQYLHVMLEPAMARLNARLVDVSVRDTTLVPRGSFRLLGPERADRVITRPFPGDSTTAVFTLEWPAGGEIRLNRHDVGASGDSTTCQEIAPTWTVFAPQLARLGANASVIESFDFDADGLLAISSKGMTLRFDPLSGLPASVSCDLARVEIRNRFCDYECYYEAIGRDSHGTILWRYDLKNWSALPVLAPTVEGDVRVLLLRSNATVDVLSCAGVPDGEFSLESWFGDGVAWSMACTHYDAPTDRYTTLVGGSQGFRLFTFTGSGLNGVEVPTDLEIRLDFEFAGDDTHPTDFGEVDWLKLRDTEATVRTKPIQPAYPRQRSVEYTIDLATGQIVSPEWIRSVRADPADPDGRTLVWTNSKGREFTTSLPARPALARPQARMRDAYPGSILLTDHPMPEETGVARAPSLLSIDANGQVVSDQPLIPEGSLPGSRIELVHLDEITPWRNVLNDLDPANPKVLVDLALVVGEDVGERQTPGLIDLGGPNVLFPLGWLDGPVVGRIPPRLYLTNEPQAHLEILIDEMGRIRGRQRALGGRCAGLPERFRDMAVLDAERLVLTGENGQELWLRSSDLSPIYVDLDTPRIEGTAVVFDETGADGRVDFGVPVHQALRASPGLAEVLLDEGGHWTLVEMDLARPVRERQRFDLDVLFPQQTVTRLVRATCGVTLLGGPDYIAFWPGRQQHGLPATWIHSGPVHGAETRFPLRTLQVPETPDHYLHAWAEDPISGFAEVAQFRSDPPEDEFGHPLPTWRRIFDTSDPFVLPMQRIQAVGHDPQVPSVPLWVVSPIGTQQHLTLEGEACVPGDVDGKYGISYYDIRTVLALLVDPRALPGWQRCASDFDQDGRTDIVDAVNMFRAGMQLATVAYPGEAQPATHPWRILDRGTDWWEIAVPVPAPALGLSLRVEAPEGAVRSMTLEDVGLFQSAHENRLAWATPTSEATELRVRIESAVEIERVQALAALEDGTLLAWPLRVLGNVTGVEDGRELPVATRLLPPFPNPFNPRTSIAFELQRTQRVRLEIVDLRGRVVRHLLDGVQSTGPHEVRWDGKDDHGRTVASGAYSCRLGSEEGTFVHRLLLLR